MMISYCCGGRFVICDWPRAPGRAFSRAFEPKPFCLLIISASARSCSSIDRSAPAHHAISATDKQGNRMRGSCGRIDERLLSDAQPLILCLTHC
jgi:hypothetical protein